MKEDNKDEMEETVWDIRVQDDLLMDEPTTGVSIEEEIRKRTGAYQNPNLLEDIVRFARERSDG